MKTITTVEELEALPEGAVIRDRYQTLGELTGDGWQFPCSKDIKPSRVALPAALLYPVIFDAEDVHVATGVASTAAPYRELHPSQAESIARAVLGAVGSVEA